MKIIEIRMAKISSVKRVTKRTRKLPSAATTITEITKTHIPIQHLIGKNSMSLDSANWTENKMLSTQISLSCRRCETLNTQTGQHKVSLYHGSTYINTHNYKLYSRSQTICLASHDTFVNTYYSSVMFPSLRGNFYRTPTRV